MIQTKFSLLAILGLGATAAFAGPKDEMDYGRFLSGSYTNQELKGADGKVAQKAQNTLETKTGLTADKGIAVKLGNKEGGMIFDSDLCRMSGGWTGAYLKFKGVAYDDSHGPNPGPADNAQMFFQVNRGPGWSKGDNLADPRKLPTGAGAAKIPFGPLPQDWAKYKGLYVNGDKVVVTYTVGAAGVMEMPDLERTGDVEVVTRTFNIVSNGAGASVVLADGPEGSAATIENGVGVAPNSSVDPDSRVVVNVIGAPAGSQLQVNGARLSFKLPQLTQGAKFKVVYACGASADVAKLTEAVKKGSAIEDLTKLKNGGPSHWSEVLTTKGVIGNNDKAYTVDTLTIPFENPFKSSMRLGALDFFKDGKRAAVSTWNGDVWIVSGIDDKLENLQWKRYATGLFQPLGLKIVDDTIYVLGRDQITRLHDLNGDNEADWYENFNNDVQVTPGFHEFAFDLQTDPQGNFYFSKGGPVNPGGRGWGPLSDHNGCIFKVSKDGSKFEIVATGVRAPNGIGMSPTGELTTGDNQGTWVPACFLHSVKPGEFIGVTDLAHREPKPTDYSRHILFFPMDTDNSGGGQVWVTSDKFGPLKGELLHASYGKSSVYGILREKVGEMDQGGAYRLPVQFESGVMRPRFNAVDGQLYLVGLKGWQTNGAKPAAFQRVRYTGKTVTFPSSLKVTDKGIHIGFTNEIDAATAADVQNYSIEQWNYRWTSEYGSPDFKVSDPNAKGRDVVEVKSVKVSPNKKEVFLEIPGLQPVMQMAIKMNLKAADGTTIPDRIVNTINAVGKEG